MRIFILMLLLSSGLTAFSGEGIWVKREKLDNLVPGMFYGLETPSMFGEGLKDYGSCVGRVYLDYTRDDQSDLSLSSRWYVLVTLEWQQGGSTVEQVLKVGTESGAVLYKDYLEIPIDSPDQGFEFKLKKIEGWYESSGSGWVQASAQGDVHFPDDIDLRLTIEEQKSYECDPDRVQTFLLKQQKPQ